MSVYQVFGLFKSWVQQSWYLGQDTKLHPHTAPSCEEPLGFVGGKHLVRAVPKNDGCIDDGYW